MRPGELPTLRQDRREPETPHRKQRPFEIVDVVGSAELRGLLPSNWPNTTTEDLVGLASRYLDEVSPLVGECTMFTDKMPYNFFSGTVDQQDVFQTRRLFIVAETHETTASPATFKTSPRVISTPLTNKP